MTVAFLLTSLVVAITPGTGVMHTLANAVTGGRRAGLAAAAGGTLSLVPHVIAAVTGLAALLRAGTPAFRVVTWVGVAYLLWMAWSALRDRGTLTVGGDRPPRPTSAVFRDGVLLNLLKNALDAMRDATPDVGRSVVLAVEQRDDQLEFSVTDRGAGLATDARERLFEPFFTTKSEGMGIGLNICRSIVESHKGRLWAYTPPGGGCSFRFTLPVDARVAAAVPA